MLSAAFRLPQRQLSVLEVVGCRFENLPDPHSSPCHQFQDQPVADLAGPKNDFIDSFLFDDVPVGGDLRSE
jgi:hypothetical protein